jgi:glutamate racemase
VLGCTHFPFLENAIRQAVGDVAVLIDPGPAVVRQARRRMNLAAENQGVSQVRMYSSGPPHRLRDQARELIGLDAEALPCRSEMPQLRRGSRRRRTRRRSACSWPVSLRRP